MNCWPWALPCNVLTFNPINSNLHHDHNPCTCVFATGQKRRQLHSAKTAQAHAILDSGNPDLCKAAKRKALSTALKFGAFARRRLVRTLAFDADSTRQQAAAALCRHLRRTRRRGSTAGRGVSRHRRSLS